MQLYTEIVKNDLKLIFRDKSLSVMFIVPVLIVLLFRFGVPALTNVVPVLPGYYWLIVSSLVCVAAALPAFLTGLLTLDERDENVDVVLKILPVPENFILKWRILLTILLGFLFSAFIISLNGLIRFSFFQVIFTSAEFALIPPILALTIVMLAKNKIEAAAVYKALSIFLVLPVAAFFILDDLRYIFGIVPFFWSYNSVRVLSNNFYFLLNFSGSAFYHLLILFIMYRLFRRHS